jgi:hypothetical protein
MPDLRVGHDNCLCGCTPKRQRNKSQRRPNKCPPVGEVGHGAYAPGYARKATVARNPLAESEVRLGEPPRAALRTERAEPRTGKANARRVNLPVIWLHVPNVERVTPVFATRLWFAHRTRRVRPTHTFRKIEREAPIRSFPPSAARYSAAIFPCGSDGSARRST